MLKIALETQEIASVSMDRIAPCPGEVEELTKDVWAKDTTNLLYNF